MRTQHDRRLLGQRCGVHLQVPSVGGQGVGDVALDGSREALLSIGIEKGEGDGVLGVRLYGKVALRVVSTTAFEKGKQTYPVPAIGSAVQSIQAAVFVGINLVLHTVDGESAVLDAVRVAP